MSDALKSISLIQGLPDNLVNNNRYELRFARNVDDLEAVQRLRFEVFNLELGEGLDASYQRQRDSDPYDDQCHHLMVIERSSGSVIGTYRMQTYRKARQGEGFYTEREFNISSLSDQILENSVEVGRACIKKGHRNGLVLYLLWRGLAEYLAHTENRYLFGCCSITSQNETEAWKVMDLLKNKDLLHPEIFVEVKPEYECSAVDVEPKAWKQVKLPQLFRLYMDIGAKVGSPPAIDREFKTIDYFVILDTETLDERTQTLFFQ